jgi:hypothetical protein
MMRRRVRAVVQRLAAVIFGLALALIMAEIGIRVLYHLLPMNLQIALNSVHVTPFSDQQLAPAPLWQSDIDYQTIVRPGAVNSLQAGSPSVTFHVTSYAWWGGRVGFRSPQPQDGGVEAAALGDSFTFCFTEIEDCWVTLLGRQIGLHIANLGQPVTGSTSHARLYADFVAKPDLKLRQPRLVLWQFYGNDYNDDYGLADLNHTAHTPPAVTVRPPLPQTPLAIWLRQNSAVYVIVSALVRGRDPGVEQFVDPYRVRPNGLDIAFGQSYVRDAFDMSEPRNQEGETLSHAAILQTRDTVEKNGGKFVVILMPAKEEVYRSLTEPVMGQAAIDAIAAPRLRLLDFCQAHDLICLDLLPTLQALASQNVQLYYPTDPHFNVQGNRAAAAAIGDFLKAQGLIGSTP